MTTRSCLDDDEDEGYWMRDGALGLESRWVVRSRD